MASRVRGRKIRGRTHKCEVFDVGHGQRVSAGLWQVQAQLPCRCLALGCGCADWWQLSREGHASHGMNEEACDGVVDDRHDCDAWAMLPGQTACGETRSHILNDYLAGDYGRSSLVKHSLHHYNHSLSISMWFLSVLRALYVFLW